MSNTPDWLKALRRESDVLSGIAELLRRNPELLTEMKAKNAASNSTRSSAVSEWLELIEYVHAALKNSR
jgi:hypothetical protein